MRSHGTINKYRLDKCRCDECRAVNAEYSRRYKAKLPKKPRRELATVCRVESCDKPRSRRNSLCSTHVQRLAHHGSVDWQPPTVSQRFWAQVDYSGGCWLWTGYVMDNGYGTSARGLAHRFAYEDQVAPIPEGLTVDHLCGVRRCVNPEHLDVATGGENTRRALRVGHGFRAPETCKRGHDWREHPPYVWVRPDGSLHRECYPCRSARDCKQVDA